MVSEKKVISPTNTFENIDNAETDNNEIININLRNLIPFNGQNEYNNINMIAQDMPLPVLMNNNGFFFHAINIRNINGFRRIRLRNIRRLQESNIAYLLGFFFGFMLNIFSLCFLFAFRLRPKLKIGMLLGMLLSLCFIFAPFLDEISRKLN